jgi:thiol-disulfide isomerase/thioredoxin
MLKWSGTIALCLVIQALTMSINGNAAPHDTAKPALKALDGPGLKRTIATHRGKVVLVNLWATWCEPCVAEFPDLVKLHETYRSRGLVVIAASLDDPETQGRVKPFLDRQKATFPAYVRKPGDLDAFVHTLDRGWDGPVPITYLFDRAGRMVGKPLIGAHTYAKFAAAVEPLLR